MKYTIHPYVSAWNGSRVWVFDDPSKGLKDEGLVSGTDAIMDRLSEQFPNGDKGFKLTFADEPFEGAQLQFDLVGAGEGGDQFASGVGGNWYEQKETGHKGWLCPALLLYFPEPPKHIYVQAEPLEGTLERGTGRIIIQGRD